MKMISDKKQKLKHVLIGISTLALTVAITVETASAQTAGQNTGPQQFNVDEIIVTARQRSESLQDAPVTVTALTETQLERIGVSSISDYASLVPNLFLVETQNSTFSFPNIRGITQSRNLDPSVAIVVDGVLSTSPIALSQELFDVQQIEVYKGPQGALYGRNAIGGAINITTKKPSNEFEGLLKLEYGNGKSGKAQAVVSGPIIEDQLYARGAISFRDSEGVRENVTLGVPSDPSRNVSARTRVIWEPTDNFSADVRASFSDDTNSAIGFIDIAPIFIESAPGSGVNFGNVIGLFPPFTPNANSGGTVTNDGSVATDFLVPGQLANIGDADNIDSFDVQTNLLGIDEREIYNLALKLDYETEHFNVTSVTSYDEAKNSTRGEQPPRTAVNTQINSQYRTSEAISQEIRFTSPDEQRLRWIAGGYGALTDTFLSTTVQLDVTGRDSLSDFVTDDPFINEICTGFAGQRPDGSTFAAVGPFGTPANPGQETGLGNCVTGFNADEGESTAWALFGQLNYDLTETLELSFSARYDEDERDNTFAAPTSLVPPGVLGLPTLPAGFGEGFEQSVTFSSFQPLATVRWTPNSDFTTYATYSEGFRSGGFNAGGFAELAEANNFGIDIDPVFDQQDTRGGEVGIKTSFLDGRLEANAAGFYTEIDNYQTFNFAIIGGIGQQFVVPIDEVEVYGFEVDAKFVLNDFIQFTGAFALNESEVINDTIRPGIIGNNAPLTPDHTANFGVELSKSFDFNDLAIDAFFKADYNRVGELFFIAENFAERDALDRINFVLGADINEDWSVIGRIDNATNENFCAELFNPGGFCFPGELRKWSVELTKRF